MMTARDTGNGPVITGADQARKAFRFKGPQLGAFERGRIARAGGRLRSECPYVSTRGSFRKAWLAGWDSKDGAR